MEASFQFTTAKWIVANVVYDPHFTTWLIGIFVISLMLIFKNALGAVGRSKLPPGPRNLPVVGALFSMDTDPHLSHVFTRMAKKYGPIFYYRLGQHSIIVVSSVEGAEEVLRQKDVQFSNRANTTLFRTAAKYLGFNKQSMAFSDYNAHLKTLRKVCTMQFSTSTRLLLYENMRRYEGAVMIEGIKRQVQDGGGAKINTREFMAFLSTNITYTMLFSKRFSQANSDELKNYQDITDRVMELFMSFNLGDLFPSLEWLIPPGKRQRYEKLDQDIRNFLGRILEDHRKARTVTGYEDRDLTDLLVTLGINGQLLEDEIMGCIMDMLGGGISTSSAVAEWALLELVRNPETMGKLQREIDSVVGQDRQVEESDFGNMPYLQAVLRETFRLHHPLPLLIPHCNRAPTTLGGFYVPADTTVFVNTHAIGRDPRLWENSDEFEPERFLETSNSNISITGGSFRLLPFGSGRRMCVGYNLGLLVAQRMLTSLVHSFDWGTPAGGKIDELSTKDGVRIVNHPEEPLVLSAKARLAPSVYSSSSAAL